VAMVSGQPPPAARHFPAELVASLMPLALWLPQHVPLRPHLALAARTAVSEALLLESDDFWRRHGSVGGPL
jgi:hypothetical protein